MYRLLVRQFISQEFALIINISFDNSTPPLSAMPPIPKVAPVVSQPTPPPPQAPQETQQSLAEIQARLQAANEEKISNPTEVTTLQQEEEVSISGSNARLMVMQKLSRKTSVRLFDSEKKMLNLVHSSLV